jgi:hypothetical protein
MITDDDIAKAEEKAKQAWRAGRAEFWMLEHVGRWHAEEAARKAEL